MIADLTGANANVMYELGLRHTRDKLTVQIGEFGRLPFDINTIRTIQFSPSPVGLINARDELAQVLETGIAGEYDPVTATRVWVGAELARDVAESDPAEDVAGAGHPNAAGYQGDDRGFLDIMAEAEEKQEVLVPALEAVASCVGQLSDLAVSSTAEIERSDAAGKGMRGRLQIATKYARSLDAIANRLDTAVDEYASVLASVSAGTLALIDRMEEDTQDLAAGQDFGMSTRQAAALTRESMAHLAEMVESINVNAQLSRVLREPSRRLTGALERFATATSLVDEWDRRLQSLGIPIPPEDWEPDFGDDEDKAPAASEHDEAPGPDDANDAEARRADKPDRGRPG